MSLAPAPKWGLFSSCRHKGGAHQRESMGSNPWGNLACDSNAALGSTEVPALDQG